MVRPYSIKRKKNKSERYDKEEDEEENAGFVEEEGIQKKSKTGVTDSDEDKAETAARELAGTPVILNKHLGNDKNIPGVIFILEKASLEVAKVGKRYQLLNSEDHADFLRKNNRSPLDFNRPDICHQAILNILDSAVNKSGKLRALYVRTEKGVLIEIKPHARIPRTFKRFSGVMLQLLQKLSIYADGKPNQEKLMRVIKNPVTQYLPVNSHAIGFSRSSKKLVDMHDYVATLDKDATLVFVVGAMAHGKIENDYVKDFISISGYNLSAAYCITRITNALERKQKIL